MKTVVVTLTPRDDAAKERLAKWANTSAQGGTFSKEYTVADDGTTTFRMTSPVNMPEVYIRKLIDPVINKVIIDRINKEKINTDISITYE